MMTERSIPRIQPANIREPWLVAFTTLARNSAGAVFDYGADKNPAKRNALAAALQPLSLTWLTLEHGARVVTIPADRPCTCELPSDDVSPAPVSGIARTRPRTYEHLPIADAAVVVEPGFAAALTTADCLPVIVVNPTQPSVAVIHAGWRGIACGVIGHALKRMAELAGTNSLPSCVRAWIGPCIGPEDYEVGSEVRRELLDTPLVTPSMFATGTDGRFLADLRAMARAQLIDGGVPAHALAAHPASTKQDLSFHSVRRDKEHAGRMATVVGIL
jgi:YfiH family protein